MTDKNIPIDQAARNRALDTSASFAVSAPAGSGKTGLLTQRVLALLAQCEEPENVLAITFTKKAAAEMQSRILDALRSAEKQPSEPEADYLKTTWHLAQAVLARNTEKNWELFSCPNRLRITTIDSLCRSISQQMPFESQLGDTPEILENPSMAYEMAARETLKQLHKKHDLCPHLTHLIKHFDNKLDKIETLFIQLLAKRDQWLGVLYQTKDQRKQLELILTNIIEEQLLDIQDTLEPIASELAILADHAANHLQDSTSLITHCLSLTGLPNNDTQAIPQWLGLAELLLTRQGKLRKSATKSIGFLAPSDKTLSKEQQENAKIYKQRFTDLLSHCQIIPDLEDILQAVRQLPTPHYQEKQWQLLDSLTHILLYLAQNLSVVFQQLGKADYLAITLAALDALGESDKPSDLALALDYKIQHILVDEFQDTSTTQLELLQKLTAGWQHDDGRTLFIVGDAMQSCYRFRDANVGIFLSVRDHGIGDIFLEPLDLQVNFRSQQGIVDWVNHSFSTIFPVNDDSHRGAVSYQPSASFNPALDVPAVQSHLLSYIDQPPSRVDEANTVVSIIQQNKQQRPKDSIAILVRSKIHAQEIIAALSYADIEYQATDIDRLDTCMPVLDCLSLTRALLYPNDRMAWLAVLRAPWCGINMEDLLQIAHHNRNDEKSWPLLMNTIMCHKLTISKTGQQKLQRFAAIIKQAFEQQKRHSLRHWIQGIWLTLGGASLLIDKNDEHNINTFFMLLDRYEQGGTIPRWSDLENAVTMLYAAPKKQNTPSENAPVQIMTIHKSKGLEFDTVIIPSLEKRSRTNDKELILWLERIAYSQQSHQQERQLLISPVNATGDDNDKIYEFIQQQHKQKDQLESDRLLYVACTRAIKQLHFIAYTAINPDLNQENTPLQVEDLKEPAKQSLLYRLWPSIQQGDSEYQHIIRIASSDTEKNHIRLRSKLTHPNHIVSLQENSQLPPTPSNALLARYRGNNVLSKISQQQEHTDISNNEDLRENIARPDELLQREQRYIGTIIHLALQHITETGYKDWSPQRIQEQRPIWKAQLTQEGINSKQVNKAVDTVEQAVTNTLNDKKGQWILDNTHQHSATELEIWDKQGLHIVDRTFIDTTDKGSTRWIIDYKSSQPSENENIEAFLLRQKEQYQDQLARYQYLFSDQEITTRTAIYFPLSTYFLEV